MLQAMYEAVLREASRAEDLAGDLNGEVLVAVWPELYLPKGLRRAWEDRHPRAARRPAGGCLMPVSDLHREVAAVALGAAARYGFALGGGNALIAHGGYGRAAR